MNLNGYPQVPQASNDAVANDSDPSTYVGSHGLACGGIIAAVQNNSVCGVGIAHQCNLGSK